MKNIGKIASFLTRYISIIILFFSAAAFWKPEGFSWATNYTSIFLGVAMFGMGLTIKAKDFKIVFSKPKEILAGCIAQYTVMPLCAWFLSVVLGLEPDLAIGVILVGCCPGGTASNVITYIAGGDVALSVGGASVEVSLWAMILSVVKVILIPVLLGILLHKIFSRQIEKIHEVLPLVSVISIVMIISGIIASNKEKVITSGAVVLGVVILHNLLGMLLGLGTAKVLRIEYPKATAIAIEVGMQNSGLAVSLATANFAANPLATLPGAIFSVWHNIAGSIFAGIRRRSMTKSNCEIK